MVRIRRHYTRRRRGTAGDSLGSGPRGDTPHPGLTRRQQCPGDKYGPPALCPHALELEQSASRL